jgi:hypothetical protein
MPDAVHEADNSALVFYLEHCKITSLFFTYQILANKKNEKKFFISKI